MVFTPPNWVPQLPLDPPDSVTIGEFMANEQYGRFPISKSRNPYTCGTTGKSFSATEVIEREDYLARGLGREMGFHPQHGSEWDKVVAIYAWNTIDYIPLTHAIHRLNGIVTPASAAYNAAELEHQLRASNAKALFTCLSMLDSATAAARAVGISTDRLFILPMPGDERNAGFRTIEDFISEGRTLPALAPLAWAPGQGAKQVAYLCYSSGTSGLPKGVMISHRNVIANTLQKVTYDSVGRSANMVETQVALGALPFSHIYGLIAVTHLGTCRGDEIIVLPRFDFTNFLRAVERFRIQQISVVPPILIRMLSAKDECKKYDLSSVRSVFTGAAPLGRESIDDLLNMNPHWVIGQGYGLTETATVVTGSSELDIWPGSIGSLLPGMKGKLVDTENNEITSYDTPGELLVQSPSVALGYLNNEQATAETFVTMQDGRWMRTGDEVLVRKAPSGNEHLFVVDRIKELIKVKGHQVAPAELEALLLSHAHVDDCAVIRVPDASAGELPKAFVVKSRSCGDLSDERVVKEIHKFVQEQKARHKWLKGGIEFIDIIPKSPSGKILRRLLRDKDQKAREGTRSKL